MRLQTVESALAAMMTLIMVTVMGADGSPLAYAVPVIGTVAAPGTFRLDNATVVGNATLFEGALVETRGAASRMELSSGARISLGQDSRAKIYGDHLILERGEGQIEKAATFQFHARGLTIQPETGNASARVILSGARVDLAVYAGSFRVLNARGELVANALTGKSIQLEPQSSDTITKLTGTLRQASGHYLLTDETTGVTVELAGPGLSRDVGYRVEITGTTDTMATRVSDAAYFIRVSSVKRLEKRSQTGGAAAAGKGGAAAGGAAAGGARISATTFAIIAGVAAAATVGGLAGSGKLSGSSSSPTPISR